MFLYISNMTLQAHTHACVTTRSRKGNSACAGKVSQQPFQGTHKKDRSVAFADCCDVTVPTMVPSNYQCENEDGTKEQEERDICQSSVGISAFPRTRNWVARHFPGDSTPLWPITVPRFQLSDRNINFKHIGDPVSMECKASLLFLPMVSPPCTGNYQPLSTHSFLHFVDTSF